MNAAGDTRSLWGPEMIKCQMCGSTEPGDQFDDGTGYECPRCMSNVFYQLNGYTITDTELAVIVTRPNGTLLGNHYANVNEALSAVALVTA